MNKNKKELIIELANKIRHTDRLYCDTVGCDVCPVKKGDSCLSVDLHNELDEKEKDFNMFYSHGKVYTKQ